VVDRHCDADLAIAAAVGSDAVEGIVLAVLDPVVGMCSCRP
jgi:hypothetical protein